VVVDHHEEINQMDEQCLSSSLSGLALLFRKRKLNFYYRRLHKFDVKKDARATHRCDPSSDVAALCLETAEIKLNAKIQDDIRDCYDARTFISAWSGQLIKLFSNAIIRAAINHSN